MKIDHNRPNLDPSLQSERADATRRTDSKTTDRAATGGAHGDAVKLSRDAQLATTAAAAASQPDAIRADVVERAKRLLASGKLGEDVHKLADKLIDRTLSIDE